MTDESVGVSDPEMTQDLLKDELAQNVNPIIVDWLLSNSGSPTGNYETDLGKGQVDERSVRFEPAAKEDGLQQVELQFDAEGKLMRVLRVVGKDAAKIQVVAEVVTPRDLQVAPARRQVGARGGRKNTIYMNSRKVKWAVVITNDPHGSEAIAELPGCKWKGEHLPREELIRDICKRVGSDTRAMVLEGWRVFVYKGPVVDLYKKIVDFVKQNNHITELLNATPVSNKQPNPRVSTCAKYGEGAYIMRFSTEETGENIIHILELDHQAALCNQTPNDASRLQGNPAPWLQSGDARGNPLGYYTEKGGPARGILGHTPLRQALTSQHPYHQPVNDRRSNPLCSPHGECSSSAFTPVGGAFGALRNTTLEHQDEWSRRPRLDEIQQVASHGNCDAAARLAGTLPYTQ